MIPRSTLADPPKWLVIPAVPGEAVEGQPALQATAEALESLPPAHVRVRSSARATEMFDGRQSTPPVMVNHSDLEALARDAQQALYHVASGMPARAREDVERALSRADRVLVSLNRETQAANQLLDACLYLVRAYLQSKKPEQARAQALECRRLVPDIQASPQMHPPEVLSTLAAAEAELKAAQRGGLRVESVPDGCAVYVNGRRLGQAPLEVDDLSPGEYRVQSECGQAAIGRVHHIKVGAERVTVRIDTRFEAALRTSAGLVLHYDNPRRLAASAAAHAATLGRAVEVDDVIIVTLLGSRAGRIPGVAEDDRRRPAVPNRVDVEALRVRARDAEVLARVRFRVPAAGSMAATQASAVGEALRAARFVDLRDGRPTPLAVGPTAEPLAVGTSSTGQALADAETASGSASDGWVVPVMWVTGITGTAAIVAGWGLWGYHMSLERRYRDALDNGEDGSRELRALDDIEWIPLGVTSGGALLTTLALPWLLPVADGTPAAAWVVGLGGVAGLGAGVALSALGAGCDRGDQNARCVEAVTTTRTGGLLIATAVPLLTVPLAYMIRGGSAAPENAAHLSPTLAIWDQGAYLGITGSL